MRFRAILLTMLAAALVAIGGFANVAAQEGATPAPVPDVMLADTFGLPELQITLTDTGFEGLPAETAAGWYVVTLTYGGSGDGGAVNFVLLPEGMTIDDVVASIQAITGPPPDADVASPEPMPEMATPVDGTEDPFAWLYTTYLAGGPGAQSGQTVQGIVNLQPGEYAVIDDFFGPAAPAPLTVTGDLTAASPVASPVAAITADVTVTETGTSPDFDFTVEGALAAGQQLIEIYNDADQPHFMELIYFPGPITEAQFEAFINFDPSLGTPPPAELAGIDPNQIGLGGYASTQSPGSTQYLAVNLQPGTYVLVCFIPDPLQGGIPHAYEGMYEIVTVS